LIGVSGTRSADSFFSMKSTYIFAHLPCLQVDQQGTITSMRKDVLYVTLDAPQAPLQVTTVMTEVATLLGIYTGPPPVPLTPPLPHGKIHLSVEQQKSVRGIYLEQQLHAVST